MLLGILLNMLFLQLFFTLAPRVKEQIRFQASYKRFQNEILETVNKCLGEVK